MKTIAYWEYEPEDWSDSFTYPFISAWADGGEKVLWNFRWLVKHANIPGVKITSGDILRELRLEMPRKKGTQTNDKRDRFGDVDSKMHRGEFKWANIRLEPSDIDELERSTSTVEFLATSLCGLASDGYGFSVKPVDKGESICCTIIRSDPDNPGITYGMSSFGGELRDTLLVALYKFDVLLEGSFDGIASFCETSKSKQRFR